MFYPSHDKLKTELNRHLRIDAHLERSMEQMRFHSDSMWIQGQIVAWAEMVLHAGYLTSEHRLVGDDLFTQLKALNEAHQRRMGHHG